jgi:hypothetical protein
MVCVVASCGLFMLGTSSAATQSPVLGADWSGSGGGFGSARPSLVSNGGDPTGVVGSISWESWGGPRATGVGISDYVAPNSTVAGGTQERATIVAFSLGECDGVSAYTAVEWYFPEHGQTFESDEYENACDYFDTPKFVPSHANIGHWLSPSLIITPRSLGTVKVGVPLIEAMQAAGIAIVAGGDGVYSPQVGVGPTSLFLRLSSSYRVGCVGAGVARTPSVSTEQGFRVGETVAQLKRVYGQSLRYVPAPSTGGMTDFAGYVLSESSGNLAFDVTTSGRVVDMEGGPGIGPNSCQG